jgi:peptide/nickel transport system ATP-binding protein
MYLGRIVEIADKRELFARPRHPYTQALLSAIPVPDPVRPPRRILLKGDLPSPASPPQGCSFHPRCPVAVEQCLRVEPPLLELGGGHRASCHLVPGEASGRSN